MPALRVRASVAALLGRPALVRYRWELWLLFGMPVVGGLLHHLTMFSIERLLTCTLPGCFYSALAVSGGVRLLLLAVSYRSVRRQGRELLTLLWMLEIVTTALAWPVTLTRLVIGGDTTGLLVLFTIPLEVTTEGGGPVSTTVRYSAVSLVSLIVTLWFARRASRISSGHAFLIVMLSAAHSSFILISYSASLTSLAWYGSIAELVSPALLVGINGIMFWMMIRFDASDICTRWLFFGAAAGAMFLRGLAVSVFLWALLQPYNDLSDFYLDGYYVWWLSRAISTGLLVIAPLALAWVVRVPQRERDWLSAG